VLRLDDEVVAIARNGCNVAWRQAQRDDAGFGKFDMIQRGLRDLAALLGRDSRWHMPCSVTDFRSVAEDTYGRARMRKTQPLPPPPGSRTDASCRVHWRVRTIPP